MRDYRRLRKGVQGAAMDSRLSEILGLLVDDQPLPVRWRDHPLRGSWAGYRDAHVLPDVVLIYRRVGADLLEVVRLGSHSELFG